MPTVLELSLLWSAGTFSSAIIGVINNRPIKELTGVNETYGGGLDLLMVAASMGCIDWTKQLLASGSVDSRRDAFGWTALMIACKRGHADVVKLLLNNKEIDVNVRENMAILR